jgi:prepilin-type N-terminal cleavage/methylation domain-containing protein
MNRYSPGFSLVELLVVIVITGILMTAVTQTLITQQRGYSQQTAVVNARQSSRTVLDLLAVELRELSATDGDLLMADEDSLRFRAFRKLGTICGIDLGGGTIKLVEIGDVAFQSLDQLLVYHEEDDGWVATQAQNATDVDDCNGDEERDRQMTIGSLAITGASLGAPVRGFEEYSYGLLDLEDQWVLGRTDADGNVTALVGPLASPGESGLESGLRFVYYDQDGETLSAPLNPAARAQVARIKVTVRGKGLGAATASGEYLDLLSMQVYLRGN